MTTTFTTALDVRPISGAHREALVNLVERPRNEPPVRAACATEVSRQGNTNLLFMRLWEPRRSSTETCHNANRPHALARRRQRF